MLTKAEVKLLDAMADSISAGREENQAAHEGIGTRLDNFDGRIRAVETRQAWFSGGLALLAALGLTVLGWLGIGKGGAG